MGNKKIKSICVFGDSTAWGAWDLEKGGWVNRLWFYVAERTGGNYVTVYNLSVDGGTTETILARFESEARIRGGDAFIFQTGGNDAAYEHTPENYQVPPEKFRRNLEEIIERARAIAPHIMFMGFKNCDESKTMPVPWKDIYYTNANIRKYDEIIREICNERGALFLDVFGLLENSDLDDGLHPNAAGHEKIFIKVRDFLFEQEWI